MVGAHMPQAAGRPRAITDRPYGIEKRLPSAIAKRPVLANGLLLLFTEMLRLM